MLIGDPVGLNNSINSSFAPPDPLVLNSLITIVVAACILGAACTGWMTGAIKPPHTAAINNTKDKLRQKTFDFLMGTRRNKDGEVTSSYREL